MVQTLGIKGSGHVAILELKIYYQILNSYFDFTQLCFAT